MNVIPVIKCRDMNVSLTFYTTILGFEPAPGDKAGDPVVNIHRDGACLQLSILDGDGAYGSAVNIIVEDVGSLFNELIGRGLDTSERADSQVHSAPVRQTWGTQEFYVTDPDGNTLRFVQPER